MAKIDPATVPEDLSGMTDKDLENLGASIAEEIDSLASSLPADGRLTDEHDETLNQIEALDSAGQRVAGEIESRDELSEGRRQRLNNVLDRLGGGEGDGNPDDPPPDGDPTPPPPPTGEPTPQGVSAGAEQPEVVEPEPVPAAATARRASLATLRRPAGVAPKPASRGTFMQATGNAVAMAAGSPLEDPMAVAEAICRKRHNFGNIPQGVSGEFVSIAQGFKDLDGERISPNAEENFDTFRALRQEHSSLVAAGPCCAPFTPMYDFYRLAVPQDPVEGAIPVVPAPRGGIRFIPGLCDLTEARATIGMQACADFDEDDPPVDKPCARVSCPETQEASTTAVSQCLLFDNLQYRVFPELVAAFLEDVAVAFSSRKEVFYLDCINSHSTHVTGGNAYGAHRSLLFSWVTAAVNYRKRQGMRRDATLELFAPDWALDIMKMDLAMDNETDMDFLTVSDQQVGAFLGANNLSVTWFNDSPTGFNQKFAGVQAAGAQNTWPTHVTAFMFAPGTFARIDGGTLDVGLVRDSVLNRSNDLQIFMEEWIGCVFLGCESIALTTSVCPNGAAPQYVTPFTCP